MLVCNAFVLCHVLTFVRYIGVYYTFGILDFVRNNEDFALSRFFPINFTVTLTGLKSIVRYTEDFVIQRYVKWKFDCITR